MFKVRIIVCVIISKIQMSDEHATFKFGFLGLVFSSLRNYLPGSHMIGISHFQTGVGVAVLGLLFQMYREMTVFVLQIEVVRCR